MLRISLFDVKAELYRVLTSRGVQEDKARMVAHEMARNSLEGTYSHGINRFPRLVRNIDDGLINLEGEPRLLHAFGGIENYDGQLGLGVVNARIAMGRAIELAQTHGIGLVALGNTNHWMRAATYAYQAAEAGMAGICFGNTMPNMPAWGATDSRLGNNPIALAFPKAGGPVIADLAMSQFSYGALETARLAGRQMPYDAGYDTKGELTRDPDEIIRSMRILPMGYWKGAALSTLLDAFAGCLSLGNMVAGVGRQQGDEHGLSQVFIAIKAEAIAPREQTDAILTDALEHIMASSRKDERQRIVYPGLRAVETGAENLEKGIPVNERIWEQIRAL